MNTTARFQRTMFDLPTDETTTNSPAVRAGLFAEVVFDRPVDHRFTYAVPTHLIGSIAVGKRVEVPFGRADQSLIGYCVALSDTGPERSLKEVVQVVDEEVLLTDSILRLTRWMADYYMCSWGQVLHAVVPTAARDGVGLREAVMLELVPASQLAPTGPLSDRQAHALRILAESDGPLEQRELIKRARCGPGPIYELIRKGYVTTKLQRVESAALAIEAGPAKNPLTLNREQQAACDAIANAIRNPHFHAFLLHGVTGSGKTEVYLRAIEEVTRTGREAIVLVPEISLTPQTIERFRGRCGSLAILHSHLSDAERGGHWRRVAAGLVSVVIGARSAVFAPTRKLGLIIIDEEQESSFKQESTPRYHARDVAVMRARLEGIPIVLGSATPSLETWYNAQRGQYSLLSLPTRVAERPMPPVELIDLRHEPRSAGKTAFSAISPTLQEQMRQALSDGGQVMLFLNRRGYSTFVHCPSCGYVEACASCDLSMTYHRWKASLVCHHCNFERQPQQYCPKCGEKGKQVGLKFQGLGTEKLDAELKQKFPSHVIQRMDSDTTQQAGSHERILTAFREGLIHILVGTQMIAKGLDFPNVTLVGVINADSGLHLPDFRSAERTFQLLAQVAGRAGRGTRGGKVVVQTYNPEHPSIALAAQHDYLGFAARELRHRQLHHYPPFCRMARLVVRSLKQESALTFAEGLAAAFEKSSLNAEAAKLPEVRVLGPAEAAVFRLKGYYRYHFQISSTSPLALHRLLREGIQSLRVPADVEYQLDIDPYNML